jgi:hypothetical protein
VESAEEKASGCKRKVSAWSDLSLSVGMVVVLVVIGHVFLFVIYHVYVVKIWGNNGDRFSTR